MDCHYPPSLLLVNPRKKNYAWHMTLLDQILLVQVFVFGLLIGSFLNVCIYRIPLKKSLMGRSFCPSCNQQIPFYRNVPVFAYVFQRGRSACCQTRMSLQYPLVELLTACLSLATFWHTQNLTLYLVWFLLFVCPLIVVSIIDCYWRIIPDVISLPFILVGVAVNVFLFYPDVWLGLYLSGLGIFFGGGILLLIAEVFSRLLKKEAMGGGDIKLTAMLGAFLGLRPVFFIFFLSSVLAMIYFLVLFCARRSPRDRVIPFGPFLSMAALIYFFCGEPLIDAYIAFVLR